jgi:hypothetical protein
MARKKSVVSNIENNLDSHVKNNEDSIIEIQNEVIEPTNNIVINKSKRGRKPKNFVAQNNSNNENIVIVHSEEQNLNVDKCDSNIDESMNEIVNENDVQIKSVGKKRGRKPKGGKIIQQVLPISNIKEIKPNIILHLKCCMKDLQNNLFENNNIINGFEFSTHKKELLYEIISNNDNSANLDLFKNNPEELVELSDNESYSNKKNDVKDLWKKLKNLEYSLHLNNISDKKSACFWCTYEFDNPPIYIPKHYIKESYHVYGCFCSPECATAYLMEENIDSSTKFERYHLLNHIYSKIYDYTRNIKPAPKPYYMLEKFYGNLNIQEYRALFKNERLFLIVDKPLTRILPELHEDNDDFIINNKIIPSNTYQIKRKILQKQTKNTILNEKFGLQQNS